MARRRASVGGLQRALLGAVLGTIGAGALLVLDDANGLACLLRLRSRVAELELGLSEFERERSQLVRIAHELQTSPLAVERIAREKLGMVRPGELVLRLDDAERGLPSN